MLARQRELIARELADGTGAAISVTALKIGLRHGLRIWFADLDEKHGPVVELKPQGLKSHRVRLSFGAFSGGVLGQIAKASHEDGRLAWSLVRSVARKADVRISGQTLDDWKINDGDFEMSAVWRHEELHPDTDEAVTVTCREVIVPIMAAMAELIGYDVVEDPSASEVPEVEGALSRATVSKRERNPRSRLLCLRIHGEVCKACGLNPKVKYGAAGGIIEVHHLEPVSMLSEPRPYDPETDLVPLCPNCHRAVHTSRPWPLTLEQLLTLIGKEV